MSTRKTYEDLSVAVYRLLKAHGIRDYTMVETNKIWVRIFDEVPADTRDGLVGGLEALDPNIAVYFCH